MALGEPQHYVSQYVMGENEHIPESWQTVHSSLNAA